MFDLSKKKNSSEIIKDGTFDSRDDKQRSLRSSGGHKLGATAAVLALDIERRDDAIPWRLAKCRHVSNLARNGPTSEYVLSTLFVLVITIFRSIDKKYVIVFKYTDIR